MTAENFLPKLSPHGADDSWLLDDDDPPVSLSSSSRQGVVVEDQELERTVALPLLPRWIYRSPVHGVAAALVLSLVVGMVDLVAGREFQVMPLYLLPVSLVTWVVGRREGMLMSVFGVMIWLSAELYGATNYVHPLVPYWNAAGLLGILGTVCWILSRLHASMNSLEEVVQRRTSALLAEMGRRRRAEEARLQAERLAVVGNMSAQLAHEVRNPLGAITLNIDLLNEEIACLAKTSSHPAEESRALIDHFKEGILHIKQVVDGCMKVVRLPGSEVKPVNLTDFLQRKFHLIETELAGTRIEFKKEIDPGIPFVMTDGAKLWQALVNLLSNARQAMPDGGLLTVCSTVENDEVQISVSDTGDGIAPENLPRLYTPLFTTRAEGTGLGLVLVQQIVTELRGRIHCHSVLGAGTTFVISLPLTLPAGPFHNATPKS